MRRSSTDKSNIEVAFFSLALLVYQIMTSLYTFLPLFAGLFFCYIVIYADDLKKRKYVILALIYLSVYDLNKGFYLFSYLFFFLIFYNLFVDKIKNSFACNNCILAIYVISGYIGHYILNSFIAYILNQDLPYFSKWYLYYIVVDILLAFVFFKGKA